MCKIKNIPNSYEFTQTSSPLQWAIWFGKYIYICKIKIKETDHSQEIDIDAGKGNERKKTVWQIKCFISLFIYHSKI